MQYLLRKDNAVCKMAAILSTEVSSTRNPEVSTNNIRTISCSVIILYGVYPIFVIVTSYNVITQYIDA